MALPGPGSHLSDYDFNLIYPATHHVKYAASSDCCELKGPVGFILKDLQFFAKANIPGE